MERKEERRRWRSVGFRSIGRPEENVKPVEEEEGEGLADAWAGVV